MDIAASTAAQLSRLNRNTVQSIYMKLRQRVVGIACLEAEENTGRIEIDESYFGACRVRGKRGRGAGLGLAIVKHLVGVLDGQIYIESKVGQGTSFYVLFPLKIA